MSSFDRWVDQYMRRISLGWFLQRSAELLAIYLFVFGTTVLIVKLLVPQAWPHVLWLATASVPVCFLAWWLSRPQGFSRTETVAYLDRRLETGGLLMALAEKPDDRWMERLPNDPGIWQQAIPEIWPVRFMQVLILPLLFAIGSCFVPLREALPEAPPLINAAGTKATSELEQLLDQLEEVAVLEEKEQEELEQEIAKLTEEAKEKPLTHEKWEAIDELRNRMRTRIDTAVKDAAKAKNAVAMLAKAMQGEGPLLTREQTRQLEEEVLEMLMKMDKTKRNEAFSELSPEIRDQLQRLMKDRKFPPASELSKEDRERLLNELDEWLDEELARLQECRECEKCGKKPGGD